MQRLQQILVTPNAPGSAGGVFPQKTGYGSSPYPVFYACFDAGFSVFSGFLARRRRRWGRLEGLAAAFS